MSSKADRHRAQHVRSCRCKDRQPAGSFSFGFNAADASQITNLVVKGTKTATGSVRWSYEFDKETIPRRGGYWNVHDGKRDPVCIIQTMDVAIIAFDEVPECYAREGGEGERTMKTWKAIYWKYILSECSRIGQESSKKAPLVMERFEVVYRDPLQAE
jgi:uncharacterized protein YhfF